MVWRGVLTYTGTHLSSGASGWGLRETSNCFERLRETAEWFGAVWRGWSGSHVCRPVSTKAGFVHEVAAVDTSYLVHSIGSYNHDSWRIALRPEILCYDFHAFPNKLYFYRFFWEFVKQNGNRIFFLRA